MMIRTLCILAFLLVTVGAYTAQAATTVKFRPLAVTSQDANNAPLKAPEGVACSQTSVLVSDTGNGRLVRYSLVNDDLKNGVEIKLPQLTYPLRAKFTPKGEALVLDGKSRKIARVAADNTFVAYLDPQNVPGPAGTVTRSLAVDAKGNIYLVDILGERVLILDPAGLFIRQVPFPAHYGYISDVAVDQQGTVLILDSMKDQVYRAAANENSFKEMGKDLQDYLFFAVSIDIDSQGRVFVLDQNDNGVVLLGPDGSFLGRYLNFGWKPGQVFYPAQECLAGNDILVIADRDNSRIQMFKLQ
ncbi:NHL repeat-containing protein [Geomonas agri]|uniref:NHL repeat-containing protein n=1 Tax=Geomonas agri TaxID=2873702 RepID=UPI001CD214F1|nr:NHL repeat-containing protein [Geomonas agri]